MKKSIITALSICCLSLFSINANAQADIEELEYGIPILVEASAYSPPQCFFYEKTEKRI